MKKVVFITGGLSGIGLELGKYYLDKGHQVVVFNRKEGRYEAPDGFHIYFADITDKSTLEVAVHQAVKDIGAPHLLFNCAGILDAGTFLDQPDFIFKNVMNVNLFGQRNMTKICIPLMEKGSHIVFISSLAGLVGNYAYSAYCASKYALIGMAECLRIELKPKNIDVSIVCPGEILTPLVEKERETMDPITKKLKEFPGCLSVEQAVKKMLPAVEKRKFLIIPGIMPKLTFILSKIFPSLSRIIVDKKVKNVLKRIS